MKSADYQDSVRSKGSTQEDNEPTMFDCLFPYKTAGIMYLMVKGFIDHPCFNSCRLLSTPQLPHSGFAGAFDVTQATRVDFHMQVSTLDSPSILQNNVFITVRSRTINDV